MVSFAALITRYVSYSDLCENNDIKYYLNHEHEHDSGLDKE